MPANFCLPKSRNEALASLMRRIGICEERGSGIDKVVHETEVFQLPAPRFETTPLHTRAVLFAHKDFEAMTTQERVQACYLHACLRYMLRDYMTNESLRERFGLPPEKSAIVSKIFTAAKKSGLARMGSGTILLHGVLWTVFAVVVALGAADWWNQLLESRALTTGEQEMVALLRDSDDFALRLAIAFAAVLIQPVAEEVIFRGYLHAAIKRYSDAFLASVCSAAVFGVLHMNLEAFLPLFLLGLILSWAYEQTGSLWIPITIHALFNATTVVYQTTFASP